MNILNNFQDINKSVTAKCDKPNCQTYAKSDKQYKPDIMDIFSKKVVNQRDLNDMVTTPRAIFKGYLCFTAGKTVNGIAGFIKNEKFANPLRILGSIIAIFGTFNFVKPYLIKNSDLTNSKK